MSELESVPTWLRAALGTAVPEVFKLEQRAFEQTLKPRGIGRRGFLQSMTAAAAGLAVDPEQLLWVPGKTNIIQPLTADLSQVLGVVSAHGSRFYMQLYGLGDYKSHLVHLFFDAGWRLLHIVQRVRGVDVLVPMVIAQQVMELVRVTGRTPHELGEMACRKHHGISTEFDRNAGGASAYVHLVGERLPRKVSRVVAELGPENFARPWRNMEPDRFRDLTPDETVRIVHDANQQTAVSRGARDWRGGRRRLQRL